MSFFDLSYQDKREKMRLFAKSNSFAYEMKLFIIDEIIKKMCLINKEILLGINIEDLLNKLLTDGYVAYERVFDDKQKKIINYNEIDPCSLVIDTDDGKPIWIQYHENPSIKRVLLESQVLYLKYPILDANESLIGQIYTKQIKLYTHEKLNDFIINYVVDNVFEYISEIVEKESDFKNQLQ